MEEAYSGNRGPRWTNDGEWFEGIKDESSMGEHGNGAPGIDDDDDEHDESPHQHPRTPTELQSYTVSDSEERKEAEEYSNLRIQTVAASTTEACLPATSSPPRPHHQHYWTPQQIRRSRQLLFLLHHATTCTQQQCTLAWNCVEAKRLRDHLPMCQAGDDCPVRLCDTMRRTIFHYCECTEWDCPVCSCVREKTQRISGTGESVDTIQRMIDAMNLVDDSVFRKRGSPPSSARNQFKEPREVFLKRRRRILDTEDDNKEDSDSSVAPLPSAGVTGVSTYSAIVSEENSALSEQTGNKSALQDNSVPDDNRLRLPCVVSPSTVSYPSPGSDAAQGRSFLHHLSVDDLEKHIAHLKRKNVPATLSDEEKAKCSSYLKGLEKHHQGWVFESPFDPVQFQMMDYLDVIDKPMDLGTVRSNLEKDNYVSVQAFQADVMLIFDNAIAYFANDHLTGIRWMAEDLKAKAGADFRKLELELQRSVDERLSRPKGRTCILCEKRALQYRPPTLFCCQESCRRSRIPRNAFYYACQNSVRRVCCTTCYDESDGFVAMEQDSGRRLKIPKERLDKRKNDKQSEERWVQCNGCDSHVHHTCGLYNPESSVDKDKYCCPECILKEKHSAGPDERHGGQGLSAADLPRTELSDYLEKHVCYLANREIEELIQEEAAETGVSANEARESLDLGGAITVRQLADSPRRLGVGELMQQRYSQLNYPSEFLYRSKFFFLFQEMDGVDVALFAFCAYEHDEDNEPPNKGIVNISLLDSVHFMKPRVIRTSLYHEMLVRYLDHARTQGFNKAYIWSCPPIGGDDYIFHCRPEEQKRPTSRRLRRWYEAMLNECEKRGIVSEVTSMYDLHFAKGTDRASDVPYLASDYFSVEMDNLLAAVHKEGHDVLFNGGNDELMQRLGRKSKVILNDNYLVAILNPADRASARTAGGDGNESEYSILLNEAKTVDFTLFREGKFLELCVQKQYQFGDFRLAKYSSLMILWHLHNQSDDAIRNMDDRKLLL